jgi:CysZ protein
VLGEFLGGAYDGVRGALYLITRPRLWVYVLLPAIVAAIVLIVAVGSLLGMLSGPIAAVSAFLPGSWADNVITLLAGVALTVLSFTLLISIAAIIAGPFNEMLSESIEEKETGVAGERFQLLRFLKDLAVGLWHSIRRVAIYLVVMIALLVLGVAVPVVGSIIAAVLGAIATARFASYDAYDAVWSRRRLRYREKTAYMREHRWRTLGLGAVVSVVLIIPGLNVVGLAIGATGATLRSLALTRSERAARPADRTSVPAAP